jgi:hypothetical protein
MHYELLESRRLMSVSPTGDGPSPIDAETGGSTQLMEEEGIFYYFRHTADNHSMVLSPTRLSAGDQTLR